MKIKLECIDIILNIKKNFAHLTLVKPTKLKINKKNIMPIQLLYTDQELLRIRKSLLKKIELTKEDLNLIGQINNYCKTKK
jgi:hypothetical protein